MKWIKTPAWAWTALALLFTLSLLTLTPARAALLLLDQIAVVVDTDVIMQSEIDERFRLVKAQLVESGRRNIPPDEAIRNQIIERLIIENLQLQTAANAGVRVSDEELNQTLQGIAAENNMTLEQFREMVTQDGMGWAQTRDQIRREITISHVQRGFMRQRIQITEQEITNFLASEVGETVTSNEYRLGHILLSHPDDATGDDIRATREKAAELVETLNRGADFHNLAIEWSSGQNALDGGDMGWRKPTQLPSMFAGLVDDMAVGDVAGPVKSGQGYHLIKLLDKRGAQAEGQIPQKKVRHILIKPNEIRTDEEARELAEKLRTEIEAGEDFATVAKRYSDDPGSALSGGDLGWNRTGVFVPRFEEELQRAKLNELSHVFKTEHGYHILEVTDTRIEDFTERFKQGQAENYLRRQKFDEELENWIREIRSNAFVEFKNQQ